jgi:signal transduction histidine kinase
MKERDLPDGSTMVSPTRPMRTLLIIEDNPGDARLLCEMLAEDKSYQSELKHAGTMREAESHLKDHGVDFIMLDLGLPDAQGLAAIRRIRSVAPDIPLVVLTGMDDEELAAQSLREGAQDYLVKGEIETRALLRALRYAGQRKRLERLKDEFVSTVSHELRTPLTSITGSLGLLMGQATGSLPGPMVRLIEIAHQNCKRLVRLVNDILDIEKLESGRLVFDKKRIAVRPLVEQAVETCQAFAGRGGVRLRIENDINAVFDVRADADRLSQVIANLLSNAIKFSAQDDEVIVTIENGIDLVRVSVRDHGPGISAEFRPHIFGRFAQADATSTRRRGGTGLGLYIVKQIVDRFNGVVSFMDAPGGGTIFKVELPNWGGQSDRRHEQQLATAVAPEAEASFASLREEARERLSPVAAEDKEIILP